MKQLFYQIDKTYVVATLNPLPYFPKSKIKRSDDRMQLLPDELRLRIPKLYSQENVDTENQIVYAKFFFPAGRWTWFVTEGKPDGDDYIFFGFVAGDFDEWGYFSLNELESINVHSLTVERDLHFLILKIAVILLIIGC